MTPIFLTLCALLSFATPAVQLAYSGSERITSKTYHVSNASNLQFTNAKNAHPSIKLASEDDIRANMPQILRQNSDFARAFTKRFPSPRDMAMFLADVAKKPRSGLSNKCAIDVINGFMALEKWETWALRSE